MNRIEKTGLCLLHGLLLTLLVAACRGEGHGAGDEPPNPPLPPLAMNGLFNSGFEEIADDTTSPLKYGAYWTGAFAGEEGNPEHLVVQGRAFRGERCLRLTPGDGQVLQKVVTDPRWTDCARIILALRLEAGACLQVILEDGQGLTVSAAFEAGKKTGNTTRPSLRAAWEGQSPSEEGIRILPAGEKAPGWVLACLDAGDRFQRAFGSKPIPRLNLRLKCGGPEGAAAFVDEVYMEVHWPRLSATELSNLIIEKVLWTLETWYLPMEKGGLGLVNPETGYLEFSSFHVESGKEKHKSPFGNLHAIQNILMRWIRFAKERGWEDEVRFWMPFLERFTRSLLENNFDPETGLPRLVYLKDLKPNQKSPVTVGSYIEFLLKAREVVDDESLKAGCLKTARAAADRLIALQKAHDLPRQEHKNIVRYNKEKGKFEGRWPNWYGYIPDRLSPDGEIEHPKRFNTSWAILSGRSFWYHYFKSAAAIMEVHALEPRDEDLPAVQRVLANYHRDWDAARYDLENDTDDHYGYLCEDVIRILEQSDGRLEKALELLQKATDHRLDRDAARIDDTLWIQAVRLGTACAGDSPRALLGLLEFFELPEHINPSSQGHPFYREALLELARNDFKGRQLTNSQFTESFFKYWEMVCICFRGSYQGDCRDHPPGFWHGDVGDTFGGPPNMPIQAQTVAYRAARGGEREAILSAMGIIEHVTESTMRRTYGYLYGLDPEIAEQYELPEKYRMGVSLNSPAGLSYVLAWLKLLPFLDRSDAGQAPGVTLLGIEEGEQRLARLKAQGPGDGVVGLAVYTGDQYPLPAPLSDGDQRMSAFPLAEDWLDTSCIVRILDRAEIDIGIVMADSPYILVQPLLLDPEGGPPLAVGEALILRSDPP
ncbi:MAG: hypothetical protein ACYTG7_08255 [Planctomycetota bacterium]|jgi:hypothetical protein